MRGSGLVVVALLGAYDGAEPAQIVEQSVPEPARRTDIPGLAPTYAIRSGNLAGSHVEFTQKDDKVSAEWVSPQGITYGRGIYAWTPSTHSFNGTAVLQIGCEPENDQTPIKSVDVVIREEIHIVNPVEIRNRWMKPMRIDCATGSLELYQWTERLWQVPDAALPPAAMP